MKVTTIPTSAVFATIAQNGSVSCPPYFFGRTEKFVADVTGVKLGVSVTITRTRSAEPISSIPLAEQPVWAMSHSWIAKRNEAVTIATVSSLLKAGKIQLVKGTVKGNAETLVLPVSWKSGQKLPKVVGILPSATYRNGRAESYATKEDGGSVSGNAPVRASALKVSVGDKAKPALKVEPKGKAPVKTETKVAPKAAPATLKIPVKSPAAKK